MNTGIRIAIALMALALTACGSDGGSKPASRITGVAATGDAISGGTVTLKCKGGGSVSTVTAVDGRYTLQADRLTLPCMAQVSYTDMHGSLYTLHSYVLAPGTINITPLTELVTAALLQHQPSDMFDNHIDLAFTMLAQGDPVAAWAAVKATLLAKGIQLPDNFDPVHDILQAKTDTQTGNAHDLLLDSVGLQLNLSFGGGPFDLSLATGSGLQTHTVVTGLRWGRISTGSPGAYDFFSDLSTQQFGSYYPTTAPVTITLAQAAQTQQLTGLYSGSLDSGDSCAFTLNADGSILLPGNGDEAEHLIAASAFREASAPLLNVWVFSEGEAGRQGFLFVRAASADAEGAVMLRIYEREKMPANCTAPLATASAT